MPNFSLKKIYEIFAQKGVWEINRKIEEGKEKDRLTKFICFFDQKFLGLAAFINHLAKLEKSIPELGLANTSTEFLKKIGVIVKESKTFLPLLDKEGKAVLFIGLNHDMWLEPLFLASLIKRKDILAIGEKSFQYLGKNLANYIVPVFWKRYAIDGHHSFEKKIKNHMRIFHNLINFRCYEKLTLAQIKKMNNSAFKKSSGHLASGGALLIFPGGEGPAGNSWRKGIGEIILKIPPSKRKNVTLVPLSFYGPSKKLLIKNARLAYTGKRPQKTEATILPGKEINLNDFYKKIGCQKNSSQISFLLQKMVISNITPD